MLGSVVLIGLSIAAMQTPPAEQNTAAQVTIQQLEERLSASNPGAAPTEAPLVLLQDDNLAQQIVHLQLTERLSPGTLERIIKSHSLGPHVKKALDELADRSALLDPPAGELPALPAPNDAEQKRMLDAAHVFVFKTLSRLPNFFATRTTYRFFGVPPELNRTGFQMYIGLHAMGSYSREITYRDGKEVLDPMKVDSPGPKSSHRAVARWSQSALETRGEFGPEPAVILMDTDGGTISFHHWEQGQQGSIAVYRFSVPEESSHYEVNYACNYNNSFHAQPAYHGSLAIDPTSGAIMRLTLEADSKANDPISHVASVIEYGPVDIGGKTYICPLRSLAFSVDESNACSVGGHNSRLVQRMVLNRTLFTAYHRLGSTVRILTDPADAKQDQKTAKPQE